MQECSIGSARSHRSETWAQILLSQTEKQMSDVPYLLDIRTVAMEDVCLERYGAPHHQDIQAASLTQRNPTVPERS
jgi:hypothetical protein